MGGLVAFHKAALVLAVPGILDKESTVGSATSEQCTVVPRGLMTLLMGLTNTLVPLKIVGISCEQFPGVRECGGTETG